MINRFIPHLGLIGTCSALLLAACSSTKPHFAPKGDGYFEITALTKEDVYQVSYEVCRGIHQSGYQIISPSHLQPNEMYAGVVRCSGKVDPVLERQYAESSKKFSIVEGLGEEKTYFEIK